MLYYYLIRYKKRKGDILTPIERNAHTVRAKYAIQLRIICLHVEFIAVIKMKNRNIMLSEESHKHLDYYGPAEPPVRCGVSH